VFQPRCPSSKGVKNFRAMRGCDARPPERATPGFLTSPTLASVSCVRPGRSTSSSRTSPRSGPTGIGVVRGIRVPLRGGTRRWLGISVPSQAVLADPLVASTRSRSSRRDLLGRYLRLSTAWFAAADGVTVRTDRWLHHHADSEDQDALTLCRNAETLTEPHRRKPNLPNGSRWISASSLHRRSTSRTSAPALTLERFPPRTRRGQAA
jgi:hypothetical protein